MAQSQEIRRKFLNYFQKNDHYLVPSSSVVPHEDPTLLFINAGMNQFKETFLGAAKREYRRAASCQKCIRVGGKHNDLDNVGHTSRHLTFFEMLGNFSFGDYFKKDAIDFAWRACLEVFEMDPKKLWVSVFHKDEEAYGLWKKYLPEAKIVRMGEKDNFWSMGETGPCGPCSELYYDRGPKYGSFQSVLEDPSGERYIEFWNLVFMQYNRDQGGKMSPLPQKSIDTGAGMERIIALLMGVDSLFETDILRGLIACLENTCKKTYDPHNLQTAPAFHVIADHLRSLAFAIADGAQPSNVERGYVLRKILRRAHRYGRMLGMQRPFLSSMLPRLIDGMGEDYPQLIASKQRIEEILNLEEENFIRTLERGGNLLTKVIQGSHEKKKISGDDAFKLKDTYGFPLEEILLIAKDANLEVDTALFSQREEEARKRSKASHKKHHQAGSKELFSQMQEKYGSTSFLGHQSTKSRGKVLAILHENQTVPSLQANQEGIIILDETPFYAEKGGQVGDQGCIQKDQARFLVLDTQDAKDGLIIHRGKMQENELHVGDAIEAIVDDVKRCLIAKNHTATHLLHNALVEVLGPHIKQAGSLVDAKRTRFDFNHHKALNQEEIDAIENLVNERICQNQSVKSYEMDYEDAQKNTHIKQFFGEKYGKKVRVVDMDFSQELCGGTHTSKTGDIGLFRITKEASIASGVRRIEAITGSLALEYCREKEAVIEKACRKMKTQSAKFSQRLEQILEENQELKNKLKAIRTQQRQALCDHLMEKIEKVGKIPFISSQVDFDLNELRPLAQDVMQKMQSGVVILGAAANASCQLVVMISQDWIQEGFSAHDIIKGIAPTIQGGGGGKKDFAQARGKDTSHLNQALKQARQSLEVTC